MHGYKWPINCTRTRTVDHHGAANFNNQYIFAVRPPTKVQEVSSSQFGTFGTHGAAPGRGQAFFKTRKTAEYIHEAKELYG